MALGFKSLSNPVKSNLAASTATPVPPWAVLSLATNAILLFTVVLLLLETPKTSDSEAARLDGDRPGTPTTAPTPTPTPQLGPRHTWTYEEWVEQLDKEARAIAANPPPRLGILAGDSISLWFPPQLLPPQLTWLNQGISGEISRGLLERLPLFDEVKAEVIFVMIGINDLLRGIPPAQILENQRLIIRDLLTWHPNSEIVVQSILPHSGPQATWEGRDRLLEIPNEQIKSINRELEAIARNEGVRFLNLYPLFANAEGNLKPELSTDGLHLNDEGYEVWRAALMTYIELEL
jgi:lysophospholipase L1-like esterase